MEMLPKKWDCEIFYEEYSDSYPWSMMISQENSEHQLTGQLTIVSQENSESNQKHLAQILKQALCLVAGHDSGKQQGTVVQSLFRDFLQGRHLDENGFRTFYQMQGWEPSQPGVVASWKKMMQVAGITDIRCGPCAVIFLRSYLSGVGGAGMGILSVEFR